MPKSSKKRKEKAADFSKAKLKLGKGKKIPDNAVDTSFKARSIVLPTQSITVIKDLDVPTTKKKLTFDDLVSHLKHYNAGTRKDAILGLRELLDNYPKLIPELLTSIINSCVRLMSDEDASVRRTLLLFFQWLLPQVAIEHLIPHSSVILLFTTSAQTHIFPEIRLDTIRFLDLLLEFIPHIVVEGWSNPGNTHGKRVLDGYLGLLNGGSKFGEGGDAGPVQATSTASVVLSAASKLIVLKSLSTFLHRALNASSHRESHGASSSTPTWYMASSFASQAAYDSFNSMLLQSSHPESIEMQWGQGPDHVVEDGAFLGKFPLVMTRENVGLNLQDLSNVADLNTPEKPDVIHILHLSYTLHPLLVSIFLDCAPSVFSPGSNPSETELHLVTTLAEICCVLYNAIFQGQTSHEISRACDELTVVLEHMSPYFPFHVGMTKRDVKVEHVVQDLNLAFCELTSLLILTRRSPFTKSRPKKGKQRAAPKGNGLQDSTTPPLPIGRVSRYVAQLLEGESASSNGLSRPLSHSAYTALLPTIWSLLNMSGDEQITVDIVEKIIEHAMRTSSTSTVKKGTIEFIGRLIMLRTEPQYLGSFRTDGSNEVESRFEEWIIQLPKTLWELGANNICTSEIIICLLLRLMQRKTCKAQIISAVCTRLIPYFVVSHHVRGEIAGPFGKLPVWCRRLVLDLVATAISIGPYLGELGTAVEKARMTDSDRSYWIQIRQ